MYLAPILLCLIALDRYMTTNRTNISTPCCLCTSGCQKLRNIYQSVTAWFGSLFSSSIDNILHICFTIAHPCTKGEYAENAFSSFVPPRIADEHFMIMFSCMIFECVDASRKRHYFARNLPFCFRNRVEIELKLRIFGRRHRKIERREA